MRLLIVIFFACFTLGSNASDVVKVGIYSGIKSLGAVVTPTKGEYFVIHNTDTLFIAEDESLEVRASHSQIRLTLRGQNYLFERKVVFQINGWDCEFNLKPSGLKPRTYYDNLIIYARNNQLVYVNEVDLEKYVAGVVESEAGAYHTKEYYKVQSVISRTYALAHLQRHQKEGFHVCDKVHCQVMYGKVSYNDDILFAAYETQGQVLVDDSIELITAAFHSNCGGHTVNAETVWSKPLPYLVGVQDTFCLVMSQSHWEKDIPIGQWRDFLEKNHIELPKDSTGKTLAWFPSAKTEFYGKDSSVLRMVDVRNHFNLRSAWFAVEELEDHVHLTGRGFGHGVGLCQEGAIRMAREGIPYPDILHHYYQGVHLIDMHLIPFFREE
ncbi:MAG: SpoIID/LytB domain-containing protein [Flavobacteriales bacterium]|nr:SpoIID/LytB domain-containing protein [Flavobacteriales bacterium]